MNSKLPLSLVLAAGILSACATGGKPNFINMSEEEIYAYNLEQPLRSKVYCFEEKGTGSYIRRRQCMTVEEYVYRLERSVLALDVMQPASGFNALGRGLD